MEIIRYGIGMLFVTLAVVNDYRTYKIKNNLVLGFLCTGFIFNIAFGGLNGGIDAFGGSLFPLVLFPLFALKMLGAGDIKAFCAIGSIVGLDQSINTVIFSIIAGGTIALGFLVLRSNAMVRFRAFWRYLTTCFYMRRLLPYDQFSDPEGKFRFAYGIFCGFIIAVVNHYFQIIQI